MKLIEKERMKIDEIDQEIIELINKRFKITNSIGKIKSNNKQVIRDEKREQEIIRKLKDKYQEVDPKLIEEIYKKIFEFSVKEQKELIN